MLSKGIKAPKGAVINLNGKRINVHVGRNPTSAFTLYADLLRDTPALFNQALRPDADATDRTICLPDTSANAFQTYAHWLYHGDLPGRVWGRADGDKDDTAEAGAKYAHLATAYVLGERLEHDAFCDLVLDAIIGLGNTKGENGSCALPGRSIVRYVYRNTVSDSPLRRYLVDIYVANGTREWLPEDEEREGALPGEFLLRLARGLFDNRGKGVELGGVEACRYHRHELGSEKCYRKREEKEDGDDADKGAESVENSED